MAWKFCHSDRSQKLPHLKSKSQRCLKLRRKGKCESVLLIAEETRFVEGEYGADSKMLYTDTGAVDSARAAEHIA